MTAMTTKRILDQEIPQQRFPTASYCFKDSVYCPITFTHRNVCYTHTDTRIFFLKVTIDNIKNEALKIWCKQCRVFMRSFHKLQSGNWGSFITSAGQQVSTEQKCTYKPFYPIQRFSRCEPMHSLSDLGKEQRWGKAFIKKKMHSFMVSMIKTWY